MGSFKPSLTVAVLLSLFAGNAWAISPYYLTDLGTLGGVGGENLLASATASGINNSGQVVGGSYATNGAWHAFRTGPDQPINPAADDLGTLGGNESDAYAINDSGEVVGSAVTSSGAEHAFRTGANQPINPATDDLGTLGGKSNSWAFGINASGQVVGASGSSLAADPRGFRTAANKPINPATDDLGTLGGTNCHAYGINDGGQVVGDSTAGTSGSYSYNAFRTAANQKINPATDNLGKYNTALYTEATAINGIGEVVGMMTGSNGFDAFRTAPNQPINPATDDLGNLGYYQVIAFGINNEGQVVGTAYPSLSPSGGHGFVYTDAGRMQDLNNLIAPGIGWTISDARGINDYGQIACSGTTLNGMVGHAILLTPALAGDANLDDKVDVNDLTRVLTSFGYTISSGVSGINAWMTGDFNGDYRVDINDLTILLSNFGKTSGAGPGAVPEPSALAPWPPPRWFRWPWPAAGRAKCKPHTPCVAEGPARSFECWLARLPDHSRCRHSLAGSEILTRSASEGA